MPRARTAERARRRRIATAFDAPRARDVRATIRFSGRNLKAHHVDFFAIVS
jgi:hypothetical protein